MERTTWPGLEDFQGLRKTWYGGKLIDPSGRRVASLTDDYRFRIRNASIYWGSYMHPYFIPWPTLSQTPQGRPRAGALVTALADESTSIQWFDPDILFYFQVWDRLDGVNGSRLEPDIRLDDDGDISIAALHAPWADDELLGRYSVRDGRWVHEPHGSWIEFTRGACSALAEGLRAPKTDLSEGEVAFVEVANYLTIHVNFGGTMYRLLERDVPVMTNTNQSTASSAC